MRPTMLAVWLLSVVAAGCYSPTLIDGKLHCATGGACPEGDYCAANNLCYQDGHTPPDGGTVDGGAVPQLLVAGARLASVAPDESLLAYYNNQTDIDSNVVGDLTVAAIATPTKAIFTAPTTFSVSFPSTGVDALYYFSSPTPSTDTGSSTLYGQLKTWTPALAAPIALSTGLVANYAFARDYSWALYLDAPAPSTTALGKVMLSRPQDCSGTVCNTTTLASGVTLQSITLTNNPAYAAYVTQSGTTVVTYEVFLVDIAQATQASVSKGTVMPYLGFTPDGGLLGIGTTTFTVVSTATAQPVLWGAAPIGATRFEAVTAGDAQTFYARLDVPSGAHVFKLTATAVTQLTTAATYDFQLPWNSSTATTASGRYLLNTSVATSSVGDLELYDLLATSPTPIPLATSAYIHAASVTNDQSILRFLDHYDSSTSRGDLTLVALPPANPPVVMDVAGSIGETSPGFVGDVLVYIDSGALLKVLDGSASTTVASGAQSYRLRTTPSSLLYFSNDVADTVHGLPIGVYVTPLP